MENIKQWSKGQIYDQIKIDERNIEKILSGELNPRMKVNCLLGLNARLDILYSIKQGLS